MKRVKAIEERQESAIEEKSKLVKNIENADNLKLTQLSYHASRLAELSDVSIFYDGKTVCQDISFTIECGDRIALAAETYAFTMTTARMIKPQNIAAAHAQNLRTLTPAGTFPPDALYSARMAFGALIYSE